MNANYQTISNVQIKAVQWDGTPASIPDFVSKYNLNDLGASPALNLMNGQTARPTDWIIEDSNSNISVYSNATFSLFFGLIP